MLVRFIHFVKSCWESSGRFPEISLHRDFVSIRRGRCWNLLLVPLKLSLVGEANFTRCSVEISYAGVLYRDGASKKSLNDLTLLLLCDPHVHLYAGDW